MRIKKLKLNTDIIAALLTLLFLYASVVKLLNFQEFISDMHNQPFPDWAIPILVWVVPLSELVICILLWIERTRLFAFWASIVALGIFTSYILLVLMHLFPYVPCSCGGVIEGFSWEQHFVFNILFLYAAVLGMAIQRIINESYDDNQVIPVH